MSESMAQSGYPNLVVTAEAQYIALPPYATPPKEMSFLSQTDGDQLCQQWPGWDYQLFEPVFSPGNSAVSMSSVQWEAEQQSHQSFEATRPTLHCTTASSVQPGDWSSFQQQQQYLQSTQSAILSSPLQWPASTDHPLTTAPARQPHPSKGRKRSKPGPEPEQEHRATATKKQATTPARRPVDPRLVSMSRNHSKNAWVGVGGASESPPASSMSYEDKGARAEDYNEDKDSDVSLGPAETDRKKPYRVKNRAAAKRCREKTKQYEVDLVNKEKQVTQEHMYLDAYVTALKNEVLFLKNQILQHGSCDCDMIQGYIARTASTVSVTGHGSCECDMIQGYIARTASTVNVTGYGVPTISQPSP